MNFMYLYKYFEQAMGGVDKFENGFIIHNVLITF